MKTQFITRTISYSKIRVISTNLDTMETHSNEYTVPGDYADMAPRDLLKEVRDTLESDTVSIAAVKVIGTVNEKRVMSLDDFIKYSTVAEEKKKGEKRKNPAGKISPGICDASPSEPAGSVRGFPTFRAGTSIAC